MCRPGLQQRPVPHQNCWPMLSLLLLRNFTPRLPLLSRLRNRRHWSFRKDRGLYPSWALRWDRIPSMKRPTPMKQYHFQQYDQGHCSRSIRSEWPQGPLLFSPQIASCSFQTSTGQQLGWSSILILHCVRLCRLPGRQLLWEYRWDLARDCRSLEAWLGS